MWLLSYLSESAKGFLAGISVALCVCSGRHKSCDDTRIPKKVP